MTLVNATRQTINVLSDIEARSVDHYGRGKARSVKSYESVPAALFIQNAKRMPSPTLSSVACLAVHTFQYYPINNMIFGKRY